MRQMSNTYSSCSIRRNGVRFPSLSRAVYCSASSLGKCIIISLSKHLQFFLFSFVRVRFEECVYVMLTIRQMDCVCVYMWCVSVCAGACKQITRNIERDKRKSVTLCTDRKVLFGWRQARNGKTSEQQRTNAIYRE